VKKHTQKIVLLVVRMRYSEFTQTGLAVKICLQIDKLTTGCAKILLKNTRNALQLMFGIFKVLLHEEIN